MHMEELTEAVCRRLLRKHNYVSRQLVREIVSAVVEEIKESLISGERIIMAGFGALEPSYRSYNTNPFTKEPDSGIYFLRILFKMSKILRERIRKEIVSGEIRLRTKQGSTSKAGRCKGEMPPLRFDPLWKPRRVPQVRGSSVRVAHEEALTTERQRLIYTYLKEHGPDTTLRISRAIGFPTNKCGGSYVGYSLRIMLRRGVLIRRVVHGAVLYSIRGEKDGKGSKEE